MMEHGFLECERSIFVVCGRQGSGKSTVISTILRTSNLSATSTSFSDLHLLSVIKPHLLITDIATESSTELQKTLKTLISSTGRLKTLILEVTLISPDQLSHLDLDQDHDISWYYTRSPYEITSSLTLPPQVTSVSVDVSRVKEWQIAAHVLRAYHTTPDTFSALSTFSTGNLTVLQNKEVFSILVNYFSGASTRTLWYVVKMLSHVVEITIQRISDINENFGKFLDIYTKNVGLMIANQIEQVISMFSGQFDPSQMFSVFPKLAVQWQQVECNRTSTPATTCQVHLQRLFSECSEHYYKHLDIDSRLQKDEYHLVTGALINMLGFEEVDKKVDGVVGDDGATVMSPRFCVLMMQMILRMQVDVPVILWGKEGSGKSTLVQYLKILYQRSRRQCKIISHDPVLQEVSELARLVQSEDSSQSDIVVVVVQLSRRKDVQNILKLVTEKTLDGEVCSSNVRFVVEFSDESIRECFDPHCLITVEVDQVIVKRFLESIGFPTEIPELLFPLLNNKSISYRNVINFAKVYSWIDQVFYLKYRHLLMPTSSITVHKSSLKSGCVLVLATEMVFGIINDDLLDEIAKHYDISQKLDILFSYTLDNVAKGLFKRDSRHLADDTYRGLFLTLISLETHIPLVLSSQFVQPQLLQSLLSNDGILTDYNCNISVLDNTATPQKVLQCYWAGLKESVTALCSGGPLQYGVVVYDGYSSPKSAATRRVISELVKCKPVRPITPDISLIILVQEGTASKELGCCLLGPGVEIEQDNVPDVRSCASNQDVIEYSDSESDITEHSNYNILSVGESTKPDLQETDDSDSFSLFKWIRKRVLPQEENFQNIANAVLIIKQLLKRTDPGKDLNTQLEGILDTWGEVLPYLCYILPSIVATAGDLVKLTKKNFVSHLVEIRIGEMCCKQIISWSNAYTFYTEIKVLATYTSSDNLRTITQHLLWYCEMSSVFCKVKNADLSQHLKVARDIASGIDTSFSNFSSWVDNQQDNRILVYYLTLLIRDKDLILSDLMDIVRGVLTIVASVEVLCVLLRSLVRKYSVGALDKIYDDIGQVLLSNNAIVSALVCVYQEEEEKRMVLLDSLPDTVTVRNVALVRQSVLFCARLLVDFYDNSNGKAKPDVDVEAYFIAKNSASSFCILNTLISETDNSAVRQYTLKHLLNKSGTECLKYCLSALPALQLDTVCSEDIVDLNEVISGYKDIKDKVYPVCTLCSTDGIIKTLDKGAACLLYHDLSRQRGTLQCDCLNTSLPGHMIPVFSIINSRNLGIHSRISVYLASQLTLDGNFFMSYFRDLLVHSDLDNIYWMGMPHDDIFDIINTVRPSEKYAGVEKAYTFYRCGNGHVYSINNCGDPLQKERCPECKEVIGGRNHVVAEQNSKYDNHEKTMIETGYTLKRDEFRPGKTTIRELSQLSTTILWYLTHAILSLRTNRYVPPDDPYLDHKQRLDLAFKDISEKLEVSPDTAIMFLLDVVKTLSVYSMDTLRYKSEIVRDSLTPQDILIMQKLEDLKSCRRHWEREFSDVVTSVGANSEVLRGNLTDCGLSKVNQKSYAGKSTEICSTDLTAIKSTCYWVTENIVRNPFSKLRTDAARLSKEDERNNNLLRTFTEEQQKLHLIQHLPFLLTLLRDLQLLLSYKVDSRTLLEPAADNIPGADIKKWYNLWCELNGIWEVSQLSYSVREMKPLDELILFDIAPRSYMCGPDTVYVLPPNCESGSVTLNMVKYLSVLQNKFAPEMSGRSYVPIEELQYLQYHRETVLPFLCDDQSHLSNYLQSHILSSISCLPTDNNIYLQTLSSRVLYYDQDSLDFENIVKFYNSLDNHVELESFEMELVKGVVGCDLWNLHKCLTGIMAGLGSGDIVLENFLRTLDIAADTVALMSRKDKLFALYKHVNLLCVRSTLFSDSPENDSVFSNLLSSFFTSSFYTKPWSTPELCEVEHKGIVSLLAEYVSLKMLHLDQPDYLVGWDLREALEFYLEQFDNRDPQMVEFVSDGIKVDHVGYLLNVVLRV